MDGRAYLEKYIADRLADGRGRPPAGGRLGFDPAEIRGVAVGLVAAGALGQEEMDRILADLERRLARLGLLTRIRVSASADVSTVPPPPVAVRQQMALRQHMAARIARERPPGHDPAASPPKLHSVIPLAGQVIRVDEAAAMLLSLERWSTMFVLRLAWADPGRELFRDGPRAERAGWRGWDDVGTQYRRCGGTASGDDGLYVEELRFAPGAPDEARLLTLSTGHDGETGRLAVALP
ncbi:hypothetical protein ACN28C_24360 [Plantactinospora sp. WMMC1484]|uniref:hypothetical protein n=1 Tax=Plantactinospora sp. WMMC1484 TaxID=3404122 RepID=UPI003BF5C0D5